MEKNLESSLQWFKKAELGLFVHWGLYSTLAGEWKGHTVPWLGEWIMNTAQIPVKEYEKLAQDFNPVKFNAREWVKRAEDAGMKYLVFTAKHHEGFAMYHSKANKFNIVDATPFKRDPIQELAKACEGTEIKLALYYSQSMDWHEKGAGNSFEDGQYGNRWDFEDGTPEEFTEYMEKKVKPQVSELLTQYGSIAMMWFDNPIPSFNRTHAVDLKNLVRKLQPKCLINARIGHGLGDIKGWGDNYMPSEKTERLAEACITMNDTWGYKKQGGGKWKSLEQIQSTINEAKNNGINLLLNVGPMGDGQFPNEAKYLLEKLASERKPLLKKLFQRYF